MIVTTAGGCTGVSIVVQCNDSLFLPFSLQSALHMDPKAPATLMHCIAHGPTRAYVALMHWAIDLHVTVDAIVYTHTYQHLCVRGVAG